MASKEQLKLVGLTCNHYSSSGMTASIINYGRSCENCEKWDGKKCTINVFDKTLAGLDQG
ncbi:hypothetical protein Q428_07200 [Fervidicella metallireducens AeB]|uniref:Uncharacterized protein n=1 Tax=Fervidicella metallireducens AeB TaxID=1403537 RepID=A0A017RV77_9CLOT|nr:hypothetical protein [Fervidicella metallireducens]EYE88547.1 hypothetical protein Q428_07200 [Fervidicella metallireducens AeB]